jgi:hypothetical protein
MAKSRGNTRLEDFEAHSVRSACIRSTRAARSAGIADKITAASSSTNAEPATGRAPGISRPPRRLPTSCANQNPQAKPRASPPMAMAAPSATTRISRCRGSDPTASRIPNSRVRPLTENASTPATPTTAMSRACRRGRPWQFPPSRPSPIQQIGVPVLSQPLQRNEPSAWPPGNRRSVPYAGLPKPHGIPGDGEASDRPQPTTSSRVTPAEDVSYPLITRKPQL